jgi:hypothetical protein
MSDESAILITPPTEAYLNNHWAIFMLGDISLTRDELLKRRKDLDAVTSIWVPVSCAKCGAPFRAAVCCGCQEWDYKAITNLGVPL